MFEDYCLTCGKELIDGRPYCNDVCQNGDLTSPSLSEASSAFSSPHLQYAHGQDVPPLVPSALGTALTPYTTTPYSASSSSASSTAWSATDDDDSEADSRDVDAAHSFSHALSFSRRPSGINNGSRKSASAFRHSRTASGSSPSLVCSLPQSAPEDVATFVFDQRFGGLDDFDLDAAPDLATEDPARPHTATITASAAKAARRKRNNRASLPTHFQMLQVSPAAAAAAAAAGTPPMHPFPKAKASPTIVSSVASTFAARPSPPTPRLSLVAGLAAVHAERQGLHHTPRGRYHRESRRNHGMSPSSPSASRSRSPSPGRRRDSEEKVADWSSALPQARGRAMRRNSIPPAKMQLPAGSAFLMRVSASPKLISAERSRGPSGSRDVGGRGRARAEELDGPGHSPAHPGLGKGRSGLVGRARKGAVEEWYGIRGQ